MDYSHKFHVISLPRQMEVYLRTYKLQNLQNHQEELQHIKLYVWECLDTYQKTICGKILLTEEHKKLYFIKRQLGHIETFGRTADHLLKLQFYGVTDFISILLGETIPVGYLLKYASSYDRKFVKFMKDMFKYYVNRKDPLIQIDPFIFKQSNTINLLEPYQEMLEYTASLRVDYNMIKNQIYLNIQCSQIFNLLIQYLPFDQTFSFYLAGCTPAQKIAMVFNVIYDLFKHQHMLELIRMVTHIKQFYHCSVLSFHIESPDKLMDWVYTDDPVQQLRFKGEDGKPPCHIPKNARFLLMNNKAIHDIYYNYSNRMLKYDDTLHLMQQWSIYVGLTRDQHSFFYLHLLPRHYIIQRPELMQCQLCFNDTPKEESCYYGCQKKEPHMICKYCLFKHLKQLDPHINICPVCNKTVQHIFIRQSPDSEPHLLQDFEQQKVIDTILKINAMGSENKK